jgi:hypothetical protein
MKVRFGVLLVALVLMAGSVVPASAVPIVVRPLESSRIGEYSNLGPAGEDHQQVADRFELSEYATLQSLTWYGRYDSLYNTAGPVGFSVRVFDDGSGSPATTPSYVLDVFVNADAQGTNYSGWPWYTYSTALPSWTLGAGTYWLSIVETHGATPPYGATQWLWADTFGTGYRAYRDQDGTSWLAGLDVNHAFTLAGTTTVPDPGSSLFLLGLGLVGLRAWRRRQ